MPINKRQIQPLPNLHKSLLIFLSIRVVIAVPLIIAISLPLPLRGAIHRLPHRIPLADKHVAPRRPILPLPAARLPAAVLDRYQVIGVDRRGTGEDLLDCAPVDARAALLERAAALFVAA